MSMGHRKEDSTTSQHFYNLAWPSAAVPVSVSDNSILSSWAGVATLTTSCCVTVPQKVISVLLKYIFCGFVGLVCVLLREIQWSAA